MTDIVDRMRAIANSPNTGAMQLELMAGALEIERLRTALHRAVEWGVASRGHDGGMARKLRDWIDNGMTGDPPEEPDWLREANPHQMEEETGCSISCIRFNDKDLIEIKIGGYRWVVSLGDAETIGNMLIDAVRSAESSRDEDRGPQQE